MNQLSSFNAERHAILLLTASPDQLGTLRTTLRATLERLAVDCVHADTLERGLACMRAGGIELIVLDAALAGPQLDNSCRRLRSAVGGAGVPLLLIPAAPGSAEQCRSIDAGAAAYLPLPLPLDDQAVAEQIITKLALRQDRPPPHPTPALVIDYHAILAGSTDPVVLYDADSRLLVEANHHAESLFGRPAAELLQGGLGELCPLRQPDGRPSRLAIDNLLQQVLGGDSRVFDLRVRQRHPLGFNPIDCELRLVPLPTGGRRLMHVRLVDISARKRAESLRGGQNALLEMIATGAPLEDTLQRLMQLIEAQSDGVSCSVLLLDARGKTIEHAWSPRLPRRFLAALEGLDIGPSVGSCGTAMFRGEPVIVSDIDHDTLWAPYRHLAAPHNLRACWSMPIRSGDAILGSFAMYYRMVRKPGLEEVHLLGTACHLAGIAIERARRETELAQHRRHLEQLVDQRTAALTRAKEQAELTGAHLAAALADLHLTQEHLMRRDKLAALGTLVAGVAHELNTPIGNSLVVTGKMAQLTHQLQASLGERVRRSELAAYLEQSAEADAIVQRNLRRAADLVSSFKQIAVDHASSKRRRFDLQQLVAQWLLPQLATLRHTGYTLEQAVPAGLGMDSYPGPLGQVLTSLVDNCVQHGFDGCSTGQIHISARIHGSSVTLAVADDGVGIAAHHQAQVFDPFFTTRPGAGGAGLGLHIAHNIVTGVLGGSIDLASDGVSGTVFTLTLPRSAPPRAAPAVTMAPAAADCEQT